MSRRNRLFASLSLGLIGAPLLAAPADTVRSRIAGLRELGAAFKNANDGLRGGEPQIIVIQQSAREIRNAATAQYQWFPVGTGANPAWKTAAKPEIWTNWDDFLKHANALKAGAEAMDVSSAETIGAGMGAFTCAAACL